jgi:cobalt-zinc-cadmium efflux system protein
VVLIVGTFVILSQAVPRILNPEPAHAPGMLLIAVIGIAVNGAAVLRLRGSESTNARMVTWHLLEDVLGWVAVLLVGLILLFFDWYVLDPILSILIGLFVLYNVVRVLKEALSLFLQAVPAHVEIASMEEKIIELEHVRSVHHTHVWSLDGEHHVLTAHVVVGVETTREQAMRLKKDIQHVLRPYNFEHVTLEIEFGDDDCAMGE